jgi:bifunctional non-homologous end joining protein LigD
MTGERVDIEAFGRTLRVSSLDKVLWPASGFTKRDLLAWYEAVAGAILPHLAGRAVTLARFPDGVDRRGWYQTNCPGGRPDWVRIARVHAVGSEEELRYCVIDEPAALLWTAQMGALELHPFLATADRPDAPLTLVFDLDPGAPAGLVECCAVALELRSRLSSSGLRAVVKTSGAKGLHLAVPLDGTDVFARTKEFARETAQDLADAWPELVTDQMPRDLRRGRVFIDWGQNDPNRSTIAPWSLRATRLPGVSTPLWWPEVEEAVAAKDAAGLRFGPREALARLARHGDPYRAAVEGGQRLPQATTVSQSIAAVSTIKSAAVAQAATDSQRPLR